MTGIGAPAVLDDLLLYRLTRLLSTAGSLVVRQCEATHGITRREWRMLAVLAERGPLLSSELAAKAHLQRSRTSAAVTALVSKELVERRPTPSDRRKAQISLSEAGKRVYAEMMPFVVKLNRELCSAMSALDSRRFDRLLAGLQARADLLARTVSVPKDERRKGRGRARLHPP